jgi:hypothetical protein
VKNQFLKMSMMVCSGLLLSGSGLWAETATLKTEALSAYAPTNGCYTVFILHRNDGQELLEAGVREALAGRSDVVVQSSRVNSPTLVGLFQQLKMEAETLPTPLVMVISSNTVVTGIFTRVPKREKLLEALLPEQPLAVRKTLLDGKSVLIKAQSKTTLGNVETDKAISDYLSDSSITNKVVVLRVDLDKAENAPFLRQLRIDPPNEKQSVLICLAPPLKIVNLAFRGAATKASIIKTASAACGTSCSTGSS